MQKFTLPLRPEDAVKKLLSFLPNKRMKDVLNKRFGLVGLKKTLDAIGKDYGVTRERVRQIEEDALKHLAKPEYYKEVEPLFDHLESQLKNHGEVAAEKHLFTNLVGDKNHSDVNFLMSVARPFSRVGETDYHHSRWFTSKEKLALSEKFLTEVASYLETKRKPVSESELAKIAEEAASTVFKEKLPQAALTSYLATSKLLKKNPFGEYGLMHWPAINPKGVRDKAYVVLAKHGSPLHFREVSEGINKVGWSSKKAHPQTVHNELIKDKRFVLVGRGLYGLTEWGYEPGTVRDIMVSVMKQAKKPMSKDEIVKRVLDKRFVKENTILLNLQNKSSFKKTQDGNYTPV